MGVPALLCGSQRSLYGKPVLCVLRYHHSNKEKHRGVTVGGNEVEWDGADSIDIPPRYAQEDLAGV